MLSFTIDLRTCQNLNENCINDYELTKSFYFDNIETLSYKEYENNINEGSQMKENDKIDLGFKLNLKLEMQIDENLKNIIEDLKFSELLLDDNTAGLPYWIKYEIDFSNKKIYFTVYVFWMKKKLKDLEKFKEMLENPEISTMIQESPFFTTSENFKNFLSPPDTKILINWLQEMKEENIIKKKDSIFIDQIVYNLGNSNYNCNESENYYNHEQDRSDDALSLLKARSDKIIEKNLTQKNKKQNITNTQNDDYQESYNSEYLQFIKSGGVVGDIITDRGSTFQAHAIKVSSLNDIKNYLTLLKSHNKINKATHNILAYRINESITNKLGKIKKNKEKEEQMTLNENFDDDDEDSAGIRLLGILQKMKIINVMVVVSRWYGGINLGQDRFKHINDSAKNLIISYKNNFEFMN